MTDSRPTKPLQWELFSGFVYSNPYRARLAGDRMDAWIDEIDSGAGFSWTISEGSCGRVLDRGYTDDLDSAKCAATLAAEELGLIPGGDA